MTDNVEQIKEKNGYYNSKKEVRGFRNPYTGNHFVKKKM